MPGWLIGIAVAVGVWVVLIAALMIAGRGSAARELRDLLPNLVRLFKGLMRDPRVSRRAKWLLGFAALWVASPIDLIPEFLPVIGPLDDVIVAALVLRYIIRRTSAAVVAEHWQGAPGTLDILLRVAGVRPAPPSQPVQPEH